MVEQNDWQVQALALHKTGTMSWREMAVMLGVPKSTLSDYLRAYMKWMSDETPYTNDIAPAHDNSRVLFISDMHIPYHHENTIPFLKMLKARYEPTRVVCLGDELDKHALSFWASDPDLMSAGDELKAALPVIAELYALFPEMDLLDFSVFAWSANTLKILSKLSRSYSGSPPTKQFR